VGIGVADGDVTGDGTAARTYVGIIGTANRGRLNIGSTASNGADAGTLAFTNGANSLADLTVDTTSGVQNTGTMYINGTRSIKIQAAATDEVVFNESGANVDFRVESDGNANMLFVDASADRLLLGGSSQDAGGTFAFTGGSGAIRHVHPAGTSKDNLMFAITGANNGFQTTVDASNLITYKFHTGGNVEAATFGTSESVFNEAGVARNFRVESDNESQMFVVDGSADAVTIGRQRFANTPTSSNNEFIHFSSPQQEVNANSSTTINLFVRSASGTVVPCCGTVYVSCENSGQNVSWSYIIDFFYSNSTFTTTARATGNSQSTATCTVQENGAGVSCTVAYTSGLGGNIRFHAGGHASVTNY